MLYVLLLLLTVDGGFATYAGPDFFTSKELCEEAAKVARTRPDVRSASCLPRSAMKGPR